MRDLIARLGDALFAACFGSGEADRIWQDAEPHLPDLRVEVDLGLSDVLPVPIELLRDPAGRPLALTCRSLAYRAAGQTGTAPAPDAPEGARVLLVISRPRITEDVPFRSVAGPLVRALAAQDHNVRLEVLRPPTFEALAAALRTAADQADPYDVVHFDGHGGTGPLDGRRQGFAVFEDPAAHDNTRLVGGAQLGALLAAASVPLLVLNACRSDYAVPGRSRADADEGRVAPYGSLARDVLAAGVSGVVAMRYDFYVSAAGGFVGALYGRLAAGVELAEAVTVARRTMVERDRATAPQVDDWLVPVVYERDKLRLALMPAGPAAPARTDDAERELYGTDDMIMALDRSLTVHSVVVVHGAVGSGKPNLENGHTIFGTS